MRREGGLKPTVPPDARERRRALDPSQSFIVQAPAGSGKTELLNQRYLTLLARVEQPENVVAITFTRKAAAEMRRRVLNALRDSGGPQPAQPHEELTWRLARAVREHGEARHWNLFDNPNRLRIRTIDALCGAIARQMPWVSRLGAPPEMLDDATELFAEAARRTLELLEQGKWSGDVETLLLHLDNNFQVLADLLAGMLARRDQWLRHVVGIADQRAALEAALARVVAEGVDRVRGLISPEIGREMVALARAAADGLAAWDRPGLTRNCAGLAALPDAESVDQWLGIAEMLLTGDGEWRRRLTVANGFPARTPHKQRCEELIAALRDDLDLRAALHELRRLPSPCFPEQQWQALASLVTLLPLAVAQLQMVFRERGQADFSELAMAASRALGEPEAPTDLAVAFDYRIQHLLVDEVQDTSVSQFELLEKLTAGWEPGDGRTLFLVGDPMQSIYRFREAEVALFLKAAREGIGGVRLEPLRLTANFRSQSGLVEWVNQAFPEALPAAADLVTGAVPFSASAAVREAGPEPAVTLHPYIGRDDQAEARRVVELIRAARERDAKAKVAVLVRARTHLAAIVPQLRQAGLRFRAMDIDSLGDVPVVSDLTALTRALLHPGDRVAWLAVLRAPWCGLTLADLHALAGEKPNAAIWDLMADDARLSADGRRRLARTRSALGAALARRPLDLREWIERAWVELGGPACLDGPADMDNAMAFFQLVERLDDGGTLDLAALSEGARRLFANPDPGAGEELQVMSIHKAKGLEFDVVIVPGLGRRPRVDDARLMLWLERPRLGGSPDLLLAPVHAAGAGPDRIYDYLRHVDARKEEYETGRLLYVAATRARSELHLLGHVSYDAGKGEIKAPAGGSLLERLWSAAAPVFAAAPRPEEIEVAVERPPHLLRRLPAGWRLPAAPKAAPTAPVSAPVSFHWVGDTLRHVGTVVHALLRTIADEGLAAWDRARVERRRAAVEAALLTEGVPPAEMARAAPLVMEAVGHALEDPRGRWILGPHEQAACEYAVGGGPSDARVDRTFIDEAGTRWIIDYKTSSHQGGGLNAFLDNERERYRQQMEGYMQLFAALEKRPVRAALYFPLLRSWREITPAARRVQQAPDSENPQLPLF